MVACPENNSRIARGKETDHSIPTTAQNRELIRLKKCRVMYSFEIGLAAALGKTCYGLRTDFKDCGEFDGRRFDLRVLYRIESSGGRLLRRIEDLDFWTLTREQEFFWKNRDKP